MKYVEFKNHIYKKLTNDFEFIKKDKEYFYDTEEVRIFFNVDKSQYSNSAMIKIGLTVDDFLKIFNRERPTSINFADVYIPFTEIGYIELDNINDFEKIDKQINDFFENVFPNLLTSSSIKKYIIDNNIKIPNRHLKKYWNIEG